MKKNAFKDFNDAFAKQQKRQSETSKNQVQSSKDSNDTEKTELKKTNEVAQEVLSMIEWSQV